MYEKLCVILWIILVAPTNNVFGEENQALTNKQHEKFKTEDSRIKRSMPIPRAKRQSPRNPNLNSKYDSDQKLQNYQKMDDKISDEPPFWGTRGRRASSEENYMDYMPPKLQKFCKYCNNKKNCKYCFGPMNNVNYDDDNEDSWERQNRNSLEIDDDIEPFWGNRGRRQEQDEPFWGTRGRRQEDLPFWGTRGRRDKSFLKLNERATEEDDPFWGNRGRRQETEPFWGNRGRRTQSDESVEYKNEDSEPFWGNRGRRKEDLKEAIIKAISDEESKLKHLFRFQKRQNNEPALSFWANRSRLSKIKYLFTPKATTKPQKPTEPGTVLDDRMYVEEPQFILVGRSSRSSGEDDPYFISRGKKRYFRYLKSELDQAARDRRGSIEEIVKSVRNDPYYIVRGKKVDPKNKLENSTNHDDLAKVKDLICSSIDLVTNNGNNVKRDTTEENERDRRYILKKLAEQLQIDPYFVSRGKKSETDHSSTDFVAEFVNEVAEKCLN